MWPAAVASARGERPHQPYRPRRRAGAARWVELTKRQTTGESKPLRRKHISPLWKRVVPGSPLRSVRDDAECVARRFSPPPPRGEGLGVGGQAFPSGRVSIDCGQLLLVRPQQEKFIFQILAGAEPLTPYPLPLTPYPSPRGGGGRRCTATNPMHHCGAAPCHLPLIRPNTPSKKIKKTASHRFMKRSSHP